MLHSGWDFVASLIHVNVRPGTPIVVLRPIEAEGFTGEKPMNGAARRIAVAMVLVLPMLVVACAQTKTNESTGQHVDDAAITIDVKTAILQDPALKVMQIEVETHKSTVQLSGFVDTPEMVVRAGAIARQVSGVSAVQNNLMVK
jgi:osmotically-inducible protein OsmY